MDKILELIAKYKKTLSDYKKAFMASGGISAEEQAILDKVEAQIKKLEELIEVYKAEKTVMPTINEPVAKGATPKSFGPSPDEIGDTDDWEKLLTDWLVMKKNTIIPMFRIPSKNNLKKDFLAMDIRPHEVKVQEIIKLFRREKSPDVPNQYLGEFIKEWLIKNEIGYAKTQIENESWHQETKKWLNGGTMRAVEAIKLEISSGNFDAPGNAQKLEEVLGRYVNDIKNKVAAAKDVPEKEIRAFLKDYLETTDVWFKNLPIGSSKGKETPQSVENVFAGLKAMGVFEWEFSGGKLYLKVSGKALNVIASSGYEIDAEGNLIPKVGGEIKTEGKVTDDLTLKGKVVIEHKDGKNKGKLEIGAKIKAPIVKGDIELKFNIDTKLKWGFQLIFASKGGGYLSKKAVELTVSTMTSAAKSLEEIYSGTLSEAEIYASINKINAEVYRLNQVLQAPIEKKEDIAFGFGLSGDKGGNVTFGAGIIIRF